jgi:NAD(P)H-quinone oxidoreductase subunit 5
MEVDSRVIDGAVNLTGLATLVSGEGLKYLENSSMHQFYALIVFAAVLGLVIVYSLV